MIQPNPPVLIVHGGAGRIADDQQQARMDGCRQAALAGWAALTATGCALEAVQAAVVALENNPLFNAGLGSTLTDAGTVEMDAAIADGATLRTGAVGAVQGIRNPVLLARSIMDEGRHVLLVGEGARAHAQSHGIAVCAPDELITAAQRQRWSKALGTVGCVAVDAQGRTAAATSTGGVFGKQVGRVGDSALHGCGNYADEWAAVSCTGLGEALIRTVLAKSIVELLCGGAQPQAALQCALDRLHEKTAGEAGAIVVDAQGRVAHARNAEHMPVCVIDRSGQPRTDL